MKTEEILRYEAEYQAMQEAFGTQLLTFDFVKPRKALERIGVGLIQFISTIQAIAWAFCQRA